MLKDIFMFLIVNVVKFGKLKNVSFYEDNITVIELESENKKYTISVRQDDIQEVKENA